jgi:predicted nucleic acid-binding protein
MVAANGQRRAAHTTRQSDWRSNLMLAAKALSQNAILVTDDLDVFGRLARLALENWLN